MDISVSEIRERIYSIRGHQVVLDNDLALFYRTRTKALNQAVRRNLDRFPVDFMFQLSVQEQRDLPDRLKFQKAESRGGRRTPPYGFTQEGVSMLSGVLNSDRAIQVNILIMRAFVQLRQVSEAQFDLAKRLERLETRSDNQFESIQEAIRSLVPYFFCQTPIFSASYFFGSTRKEFSANQVIEGSFQGKNFDFKKKDENTTDAIIDAVSKYFKISVQDLKANSRTRSIVLPRQIAIYLIRKHSEMSFKDIGKLFGGRDHSTILYAFRKVSSAIEVDSAIRKSITAILKGIDE